MKRSIEVSTVMQASFDQAAADLGSEAARVLSNQEISEDAQVHATLGLGVGAGTDLQQDVLMEFGEAHRDEDALTLPISWHPVGHEHVLPSFEGELLLTRAPVGSRLTIGGAYNVPLGPLGRFGDGLAGRRIARLSLSRLVETFARRIDDTSARSLPTPPAESTYEVVLREVSSENFIG